MKGKADKGTGGNDDAIQPTREALAEALPLSDEILKDLELGRVPLPNIALKVTRLARLLNDLTAQAVIGYELAGYPFDPDGVPPHVWKVGEAAGRVYQEKSGDEVKSFLYCTSLEQLEAQIKLGEPSLAAARDPDTVSASRTDVMYLQTPASNRLERVSIRKSVSDATGWLADRKKWIYEYALKKHYELKFSGIASDVFSRIRERVDDSIGKALPATLRRLTSAYENLRSENAEDWSNAAHSCRRVLSDLADAVFPSTDKTRRKVVNGKAIDIRLAAENYINRILCFVEDRSDSERFTDVVGSHIQFLADRLESIVEAANKGTHSVIVSREEADRYVVYTYLLVGDVLSLVK